MRKTIRISLLFIFMIFALSVFSNTTYASELDITNLEYDIHVNEDASISVTEIWNNYIEDIGTIYKTFVLDDSKYSGIENVVVTDMYTDEPLEEVTTYRQKLDEGTYLGMLNDDGDFEIAWGVGLYSSSAWREYKIEYTVKDLVALHNDCAELYWKIIGENFEIPISKITGKITFPQTISKEDLRVWGHTDTLNGEIYPTDDGEVEFTLNNIPANNMVEIRTTFPKSVITSAKFVDSKDALPSIIEEETGWAEEANARRDREKAFQKFAKIISGLIFGVLAFFEILMPIISLKKIKKIAPTVSHDYYRDLPREDATPSEANAIMNEYNADNFFGRVFSATLMDLNLKKYITFQVDRGENGYKSGSRHTKILLGEQKNKSLLKEDEIRIYNFVADAIEDNGGEISVHELQNYIYSHTSSSYSLRKAIEKYQEDFLKDGEYIEDKAKKARNKMTLWTPIAFILNIFAFGIIGSLNAGYLFSILVFMLNPVIIFLIPALASKVNVLNQKGVDEKDEWEALKKFMNDFSKMDEKDLPSIVVWRKYLVYATVFGIAKKVIKQLKVVYPDFADDEYFGSSSYMAAMYMVSNDGFSFSSPGSSGGSSYSSGGGSGGGFSSGGGGGAGSGGGGGR